ncbi:hypothetical protein [Dawidia soli]|uniref:Uncharacterized protein n=1 Tax=Dawidia soli TaxID=2782352 RepID=A0AAP2DCL5_9BACT|nr:hypothetical protein [Dawidia soli]MBT1688275.1 hypothetical protein [Dawidia soli]
MAQVDFYLDLKDKIDLISLVLEEGGYAVPAIHYEAPIYHEIRCIDDYLLYANTSVLLFIVHDSYFKEQLVWETIDKERKQFYYLRQRVGGPTIDFYSPGVIEKNGTRFVGQGNITYYTSYQSPSAGKNTEAPEAQKILYKKLLKQIKNGLALKNGKRTYWVGKNTLVSLTAGGKLMNVGDDLFDGFLHFIKENR